MVDRRRFLGWLGLGALAGAGAILGAWPGPRAARAQTGAGAPAPISEEARRQLVTVRERYGKHLTEAQSQLLLEELDGNVKEGIALRKHKLANSVEPDVIFRAELAAEPAVGSDQR
jgi:hypothetical protein